MNQTLLRYASTGALAVLSLSGLVAAHGVDISDTGPDSSNRVTLSERNSARLSNRNRIDVDNRNWQWARTGDATVSRNTSGGDATTGDAENINDTATEVSISNGGFSGSGGGGGGASASIDTTGPDSTNTINLSSRNTLNVDNSNRVDVDNSNHQSASTGDATVSRNTSGGDATTGDASNSNSTSTTVEIN